VKLFTNNSDLFENNPPMLQTDGQTTYHRNIAIAFCVALRGKMHHLRRLTLNASTRKVSYCDASSYQSCGTSRASEVQLCRAAVGCIHTVQRSAGWDWTGEQLSTPPVHRHITAHDMSHSST